MKKCNSAPNMRQNILQPLILLKTILEVKNA